ncbi:UNVERIFIED_ORG: hypothetical protein B2H98_05520 [Clostridium botulinum]
MIRIINNTLYLNDGTFYNLSNTSKKRVLQGLNSQLQEGSLTKTEYDQCLELISISKKEELKNLEEVCKPVVDYLKKNYDPHCTVVITDSQMRLVRDEIGIPVRTAQEVPVQEQYVGKCNYCNKNNKTQSSIGIVPKFCMECGKSILYQKSHSL